MIDESHSAWWSFLKDTAINWMGHVILSEPMECHTNTRIKPEALLWVAGATTVLLIYICLWTWRRRSFPHPDEVVTLHMRYVHGQPPIKVPDAAMEWDDLLIHILGHPMMMIPALGAVFYLLGEAAFQIERIQECHYVRVTTLGAELIGMFSNILIIPKTIALGRFYETALDQAWEWVLWVLGYGKPVGFGGTAAFFLLKKLRKAWTTPPATTVAVKTTTAPVRRSLCARFLSCISCGCCSCCQSRKNRVVEQADASTLLVDAPAPVQVVKQLQQRPSMKRVDPFKGYVVVKGGPHYRFSSAKLFASDFRENNGEGNGKNMPSAPPSDA